MDLSVVIITKNEAHIIEETLQSLNGITNDIIVVDSGSTDNTISIARQFASKIIEAGWYGYSQNKNIGIAAAKNDWILSIDADEVVDQKLHDTLLNFSPQNQSEVFNIRFRTFFCKKRIRFGEWGIEKHIRIFNRKAIKWNDSEVHESLVFPKDVSKKILNGHLLHYTVENLKEYRNKICNYSLMRAREYFAKGKHATLFKLYLSPFLSFFHNYILRGGFLDGKEGLTIALGSFRYSFLKYKYLHQLTMAKQPVLHLQE